MKDFKTLDEQIHYLSQTKQISFESEEFASDEAYLLNNNYYNVISCGKVKFASKLENGNHVYLESKFDDWVQYFQKDCEISEHLMKNVLNFERIINSRVAYYIGQLMETGIATEHERESIRQIIRSSKGVAAIKFVDYSGFETWKYITKMMFSDMKKLVFWLLENKKDIYIKVVKGYSFLQIA